jgi:nitrogen PTS system EIIA component
MDLADILAERAVLTCNGALDKPQLFKIIADKAAELTGFAAEDLLATLEEREDLGSTGLGNGIAVPHGKVAGLKHVTAIFARLDQPIEFDAVDDQPVDLVMLLLAPAGAGADHLKALSRVARLLRTDDVVEALRATGDVAQLYAILTQPMRTDYAA